MARLADKECRLIQDEPNMYTLEPSDEWRCSKCWQIFWYDANVEGFESPEDVAAGKDRYCTYCGCKIVGLKYNPMNRLVEEG